jgi:hypothetical protein
MCKQRVARFRRHVGTGSFMRTVLPAIGVLIVVAGSPVRTRQNYPLFSEGQLRAAMKTTGSGFELVKRAVAKGDVDNAKDYLVRSRESLATSIAFWRHSKKDDAVKMLRVVLRTMDDLDSILSAESIDSTAVNGHVEKVDAACEACHAAYREQDPVTKAYRLKARSLE